ncbi:MAG: serine hydrolase domain-containing protein [Acidobacteriota bacterium]
MTGESRSSAGAGRGKSAIPSLLMAVLVVEVSLAAAARGSGGEAERHRAPDAVAGRIIEPAMREKELPGLVLGVVRDGRVAVERGYGVGSLDSPQPPDPDTVFYIGSLSKALTAAGAMVLVERGQLDLEAPASRYLKNLPESWRSITVALFMAHQSGIPQLNRKLPTFEAMLRSADSMPLAFRPGTKQVYNNFNYAVVGKIIEAVSGMSYLDFMHREVFGPLHMDHTGYGIATADEATSYRMAGGRPVPIVHRLKGMYGIPSGHLQSTVADLLSFYEGIQPGGLLSPSAFRTMTTRVDPAFSGTPGWFEKRVGGLSVVTKNGATEGFHSILSFVPGKGDCVAMIWTSKKPKGDGLFKETAERLHEVCGAPVAGRRERAAAFRDE